MRWVTIWLALVPWGSPRDNATLSLKLQLSLGECCASSLRDLHLLFPHNRYPLLLIWKMEQCEKIPHQGHYLLHPSIQDFSDTMLWSQKTVRNYVHIHTFSLLLCVIEIRAALRPQMEGHSHQNIQLLQKHKRMNAQTWSSEQNILNRLEVKYSSEKFGCRDWIRFLGIHYNICRIKQT